MDVAQAVAHRHRHLERVASRQRGVREVERHRLDVEVERIGARGVGLERLAGDLPREHVLDADLDAGLRADLADDPLEVGRVRRLPPERRVHDDG
jgi:hypothetical protein